MIALLLILASSLFGEITQSITKYELRKKHETIYSYAILTQVTILILLVISLFFGEKFVFSASSLKLLIPRFFLDILVMEFTVRGLAKASRSTFSFTRSLTIPLLLFVDLFLGYKIRNVQIVGAMLIFTGVFMFAYKQRKETKGIWLVTFSALLSVITVSMFKYNITHYNSVVAEQFIVISGLLIYSIIRLRITGYQSPFKLIRKQFAQAQALTAGLSEVLYMFALPLMAASLVNATIRSLAVFWAILFGREYFHEKYSKQKLLYLIVIVVGLRFMVLGG